MKKSSRKGEEIQQRAGNPVGFPALCGAGAPGRAGSVPPFCSSLQLVETWLEIPPSRVVFPSHRRGARSIPRASSASRCHRECPPDFLVSGCQGRDGKVCNPIGCCFPCYKQPDASSRGGLSLAEAPEPDPAAEPGAGEAAFLVGCGFHRRRRTRRVSSLPQTRCPGWMSPRQLGCDVPWSYMGFRTPWGWTEGSLCPARSSPRDTMGFSTTRCRP